jgi:hypothetical protein
MLGETVEEGPSLKWNTPPHFSPYTLQASRRHLPPPRNALEVLKLGTMYTCPVFCICALISCRYSVQYAQGTPQATKEAILLAPITNCG